MTEPTDSLPPMARPRVAAGLLIRDHEGRILLVKPTYKDGWDIPGGYVEPGESPAHAAAREVVEELGVEVPVGRLLVVDWAPHPNEGDKILFIFDGGTCTDQWVEALVLEGAEIREVALRFLAEAHNDMPSRLARRLALADTSSPAALVYAENGRILDPGTAGSRNSASPSHVSARLRYTRGEEASEDFE